MNVRARLISGFVLMALFVLALFSWVVHRTALEINHSHEVALLADLANNQKIKLETLLEQGITPSNLLTHLDLQQTQLSASILLDQQHHFLGSSNDLALFDIPLDQFPYSQLYAENNNSLEEAFHFEHFILV